MLINLRNALMAGKRLPYDAEIEYLESTGTQWIDTGIEPAQNLAFSCTFAFEGTTTALGFGNIFGSRATSNQREYQLTGYLSGSVSVGTRNSNLGFYSGIENTVSFDGANTVNINGVSSSITTSTCSPTTGSIVLFGIRSAGVVGQLSHNKIFSLKFIRNGVLVRDYIPVRKGTVGAMYDRVSGKLFGNAGTGDFVLGPDVVPVEYIESHAAEYIAMGIAGNALSRIDIGIEKTEANGTRRFVIGSNRDPNASIGSSTYFDVNTSGYFGQNTNGFACTVGQWYNLSIRADGYYSDGVKVYSPYFVFPLRPSVELCLLSVGTATGGRWVGRVSYLKAWDTNGIPVRNLSPVRVGAEGAMMDTLTRRIYRNAGTGAFTYGNDLKYPIPAE